MKEERCISRSVGGLRPVMWFTFAEGVVCTEVWNLKEGKEKSLRNHPELAVAQLFLSELAHPAGLCGLLDGVDELAPSLADFKRTRHSATIVTNNAARDGSVAAPTGPRSRRHWWCSSSTRKSLRSSATDSTLGGSTKGERYQCAPVGNEPNLRCDSRAGNAARQNVRWSMRSS